VITRVELERREEGTLAPFAAKSGRSSGRAVPEGEHPYRTAFQRDRDRVIHSAAFRRLAYKTQVFVNHEGDYYRTRLTHSTEAAQISRTIARAIGLNEDLCEVVALGHDLGHTPFGHSGQDALDECMREHGGFEHNRQSLRVVELLERRYPEFPGLNLTREVLDGQTHRARKPVALNSEPASGEHSSFDTRHSSFRLSPLLEVQVVDAADSIAYNAHDADDALEIGLVSISQLLEVPLWREARDRVERRFKNLDHRQLRRAIVHELIDWQVGDVLAVAQRDLSDCRIYSVADARRAAPITRPSAELAEKKSGLEQFLFDEVYRHPTVLAKRRDAQLALHEMFDVLVNQPEQLPTKFARLTKRDGLPRAVADYLAGMTDRFALEEHGRLVKH